VAWDQQFYDLIKLPGQRSRCITENGWMKFAADRLYSDPEKAAAN
jgi:hypothetical protein